MAEIKLNSALNVMRRMPPSTVENSLAGLLELVPELTDDLLNRVDQPLKLEKDATGKSFILCDYNRDGDSYRSPWTNEYVPAMEDGFVPTKTLRELEIQANAIFDIYRKLYFEGGNSSVYFFNTDEKEEDAFGACFLVHKECENVRGLKTGWWDSIHVFDVKRTKADKFQYSLTSTVMVSMTVENADVGHVDLSGSMTMQLKQVNAVTAEHTHVANMGKMLENLELKLRNMIEIIYISKTREILNGTRKMGAAFNDSWKEISASLNAAVKAHGDTRVKDSD